MKLCTKCNQLKDESEFPRQRNRYNYKLFDWCKGCWKEYLKTIRNTPKKQRKHSEPRYEKECPDLSQYLPLLKRRKDDGAYHGVCKIICKHHEEMKDDPERLTTEFIQKIVKVKCD